MYIRAHGPSGRDASIEREAKVNLIITKKHQQRGQRQWHGLASTSRNLYYANWPMTIYGGFKWNPACMWLLLSREMYWWGLGLVLLVIFMVSLWCDFHGISPLWENICNLYTECNLFLSVILSVCKNMGRQNNMISVIQVTCLHHIWCT